MSQMIVLDTHIWFWWITGDTNRYPHDWNDHIENSERVGVASVSCLEIALANQKGRLHLPGSIRSWLESALYPSGIELFPLSPAICESAVQLSPIHKDPFDRTIIATALTHNARLMSIDSLFTEYSELNQLLMR